MDSDKRRFEYEEKCAALAVLQQEQIEKNITHFMSKDIPLKRGDVVVLNQVKWQVVTKDGNTITFQPVGQVRSLRKMSRNRRKGYRRSANTSN